jgi:hypothetical protein
MLATDGAVSQRNTDLARAVDAMRESTGFQDTARLGVLSGIKRRARARMIIDFSLQLEPAPPDCSITTMRAALGELFGKGVSNNDLQKYFATRGRKSNNRVDLPRWSAWWEANQVRFQTDARELLLELDLEWIGFTRAVAYEVSHQGHA